jgi:5'-3' exonuclease
MGIPGYIGRFLNQKRYKNVQLKKIQFEVNSLLIDSSSLLHICAMKTYFYGEYENEKKQEEIKNMDPKILKENYINLIISELKNVINIFKPTNNVVIAIDGVGLIAKVSQQRSRRFKNAIGKGSKISFDSSSLSPGTELMFEIDTAIKTWLAKDYIFLTSNVIYSNFLTENEGEHKILVYLKNINMNFDWGTSVIMGLDNDLIMLSLASNIPNIYLSRNNQNDIINIDGLRAGLTGELIQPSSVLDYVLFSFFIGNDFLPRPLAFSDIAAYYETSFIAYKSLRTSITHDGEINWKEFSRFITILSRGEKNLLTATANTSYKYPHQILNSSFDITSSNGNTIQLFNYNKFRGNYYTHIFAPKDKNIQSINSGFIPSPEKIEAMCINFLTMLAWNFSYYTKGPDSVNFEYFYKYNYAPLLSDLSIVAQKQAENNILEDYLYNDKQRSFNPLQQLVAIIPPASKGVLPEILHPFMEFGSPVYHLFPKTFELDRYGTNEDHQAIALLMPIDIEAIFDNVTFPSEIEKKYQPEGDYLYTHSENNEYLKEQIKLRQYMNRPKEKKEEKNEEGGEKEGKVEKIERIERIGFDKIKEIPKNEGNNFVSNRGRGRGAGNEMRGRGRGNYNNIERPERGRGRGRGRGNESAFNQ